jgi:hypothetical protein
VFKGLRESLSKVEPYPVIWLPQEPIKTDDLLTLIREAPEVRSPLEWHQRFENIFEKSRLTKSINKAVFTLTDPDRFFSFRYWIRVPEDPTNCFPEGYLLCDGGRRNKGEIDNENRLITYGRVSV